MIYLTLPELLHVAERTLGDGYAVRDFGLLEAALARPRATAFGKDAYPDLDARAAALLHSIARNHALVDGNKRLAWSATAPSVCSTGATSATSSTPRRPSSSSRANSPSPREKR